MSVSEYTDMKSNNLLTVRRIFGILLSVSVLVSGACLIAGCLSIWFCEEGEYTRPLVIETLSTVALPLLITVVLTVIGFVLEFLLPDVKKKCAEPKNNAAILARLNESRDASNGDFEAVFKERNKRKKRATVLISLICVAAVAFLAYALVPSNYSADINASVIDAMKVFLPCLALPFGYAVYVAYSNEKSLLREIELVKAIEATDKKEKSAPAAENKKVLLAVRLSLLFVALAVCLFGYFSGGFNDVLTKAVNICTECIGLG